MCRDDGAFFYSETGFFAVGVTFFEAEAFGATTFFFVAFSWDNVNVSIFLFNSLI